MIARTAARCAGTLLIAAAAAAPAAAQDAGRWITMEGVASISTTGSEPGDPMLIFDGTATVRAGAGFDIVARPYGHRLPGGDWTAEMYQLQVRYVPRTAVRMRVDAGIIAEPIGLTSLELLPDRNPTIGGPFFYYAPLPAPAAGLPPLQVISPGYPLGAMVSASGDRWDARAGVLDHTPARRRNPLAAARRPAAPQVVAGGGVTPWPGLRLGGGIARGSYDRPGGPVATVTNVEADISAGYSRLAGEWIRDSFETATTDAVTVDAFTAEAVRTLSPRWMAAVRGSVVRSPVWLGRFTVERQAAAAELTVSYRLSTDLLLKAGYQSSRWYYSSHWKGAVAVAAVVSHRWW